MAIRRIDSGDALRVLVVDDHTDTNDTLAYLLRYSGHHVAVAVNGVQALELAMEHKPEVVLLDLGLPEMDGFRVATELRQREESKGAMIVAITGYATEADKLRAAKAGFDRYFVKPMEFDRLDEVLREVAQRRATLSHPSGAIPSRSSPAPAGPDHSA